MTSVKSSISKELWREICEFLLRTTAEKESEDPAALGTVSRSAVSGADEWGAVADRWQAGVVEAAGDGLAQGTSEGRASGRPLTWITLTRPLKRVSRVLASVFLQSAARVLKRGWQVAPWGRGKACPPRPGRNCGLRDNGSGTCGTWRQSGAREQLAQAFRLRGETGIPPSRKNCRVWSCS